MDTSRIYHKIVDQILALVDSGTFPIGGRLPSERELAMQFGVSRARIREAEIVLEAQGRIKVKNGSGAYILRGTGTSLSRVPNVEVFELTEARALFVAEVAALAALLINDEAILELERLVGIMALEIKSEMSPDDADIKFHNLIARSTNNRAIMLAIDSMWKMRAKVTPFQKHHQNIYRKDGRNLEDEYHHGVLEALKNRNSIMARKATLDYFTGIMKTLLVASEVDAYQELKRKTSENRSRFLLSSQLN